MATERVRLTKKFIDSVKPPAKDSIKIFDSEMKGLALRVRAGGAKSWTLRYRYKGKEHEASEPAELYSVEDARKWAISVKLDAAKGTPHHLSKGASVAPKALTVEELGNDCLAYLKDAGRTEKYIAECKAYHTRFIVPKIGHIEAKDLTRKDADSVLRPLVGQPPTHNRVLAWLTKMLNHGRETEAVPFHWHTLLKRQSEKARDSYLTEDQLERLLSALDRSATDDCILFLALTGCRPNEAFQLAWDQVDFAEAVWRKPAANTKNRTAHTVPLSDDALALLRRREADARKLANAARALDVDPAIQASIAATAARAAKWVFHSPRPGTKEHITSVKRRFATLAKKADLPAARPYDLRKSFATLLMSKGASVRTVQSLTGHKTAAVLLKHYTQVVQEDQRKAVGMLRRKPAAHTTDAAEGG